MKFSVPYNFCGFHPLPPLCPIVIHFAFQVLSQSELSRFPKLSFFRFRANLSLVSPAPLTSLYPLHTQVITNPHNIIIVIIIIIIIFIVMMSRQPSKELWAEPDFHHLLFWNRP